MVLRRERGGPGVFGAPDTVLETGPQPDTARHSPATKAHLPWTCAGLSSPHHSGRRSALTPCSAPQQRKPEANPPGLRPAGQRLAFILDSRDARSASWSARTRWILTVTEQIVTVRRPSVCAETNLRELKC